MSRAIRATVETVEIERIEVQRRLLDTAVAEVFELMMGVPCAPLAPSADSQIAGMEAAVTAVVGLAGALSGTCVLRMGEPAVLRLAELMTGAPMSAFDRIVKDALGEACNMLAGAWKGKLAISPACMLSVPAVISGSNYEFHLPKPAFHLDRTYGFDGHRFTFCIDCVGL